MGIIFSRNKSFKMIRNLYLTLTWRRVSQLLPVGVIENKMASQWEPRGGSMDNRAYYTRMRKAKHGHPHTHIPPPWGGRRKKDHWRVFASNLAVGSVESTVSKGVERGTTRHPYYLLWFP